MPARKRKKKKKKTPWYKKVFGGSGRDDEGDTNDAKRSPLDAMSEGFKKAGLKLKAGFRDLGHRIKRGFKKVAATGPTDPGIKTEYFRRLICAKLLEKDYGELVSALQALGFKKLKWEFFSKRKSFEMYSKEIDADYRLHLRLYPLDPYFYVLAHKEPKTSANPAFHVKGFVARLASLFRQSRAGDHAGAPAGDPLADQVEPLGDAGDETHWDESAGDGRDESAGAPGRSPADARRAPVTTDKQELADYQEGAAIFREWIVTRVPNLAKKLYFSVSEEDLDRFSRRYGRIDHLSTGDLLVENLMEAAENDFRIFPDVLKDIFTILGFKVEAVDLIAAPHHEFLARAKFAKDPYVVLVGQARPDREYLEALADRGTQYDPDYVLHFLPNPEFTDAFEKLARKQHVNLLTAADLALFFLEHLEYPFPQEEIEALFAKKGGLISQTRIHELIAEKKDLERIFQQSVDLFEILQGVGEFVSVKEVHKILKRYGRSVDRDKLEAILSLLANPLIRLVERDKKDRYRALLNKEEIRLKLERLQETFKQLRPG